MARDFFAIKQTQRSCFPVEEVAHVRGAGGGKRSDGRGGAGGGKSSPTAARECRGCGGVGHLQANCPVTVARSRGHAAGGAPCSICLGRDHAARDHTQAALEEEVGAVHGGGGRRWQGRRQGRQVWRKGLWCSRYLLPVAGHWPVLAGSSVCLGGKPLEPAAASTAAARGRPVQV